MSTEIKNEVEQLTQQFKAMESADLFKVLKAGLAEAERRSKSKAKTKAGSMPKGSCPPQLKLNNAWVKHVKDYVNQNGWEAFVVPTTITDKVTGAKTIVEEELPASILHNGIHVFDGSVTEKTPQGVQVSHKHAMTLSKQWKDGEHADRYTAFVNSFDPEEDSESDAASEASSESMPVVRTTMAEKLAAKAAKEAEKAAAKLAKEAEKEAAKAAKEAKAKADKEEKEAKAALAAELRAQKLAEAEAVKAERLRAAAEEAARKAEKIPKAAVKAKAAKAETAKAETAKAKTAKPMKPKAKAWSCPDDGCAHRWEHEGTVYARNFHDEVWECDEDGDVTKWAGVYLIAEDRIDRTAEEPVYATDEE